MPTPDDIRHLVRAGWDETAATYGHDQPRLFQRFGDRLLEWMALAPSAVVLDVGAGTGIVTIRAAGQVGEGGYVVGADLSAGMLAVAREASRRAGLARTDYAQMDAEELGFPANMFDAVICAFSLFQFVDMRRALAEMARVLKPGGLLGLSNWWRGNFSPVGGLQRDLFRRFGLRRLLTNSPTFEPGALRALLEEAGLAEVRLEAEAVDVYFENPEAVWEYNLRMGPFAAMLRQQLSQKQREALHARFVEVMGDIASPDGVRCTFHPLYALARKP